MQTKKANATAPAKQVSKKTKINLAGYLSYPPEDDIYNKSKEDENIDPENPSALKTPNVTGKTGKSNEMSLSDDLSGNDLDVPGAELDDEQEKIGSEDEENNYYSLGGDDHIDLDEDFRE